MASDVLRPALTNRLWRFHPVSASESTHDKENALRQQRHRSLVYREHLYKAGIKDYDPDMALVRSFSELFPRFTGHMVGQRSLDYAILLLLSDDRTYGTDDAGEANRIIRKILEYQDLDTRLRILWQLHLDERTGIVSRTHNALSFLCSGLVYVYLNFPDKLQDSHQNRSGTSIPRDGHVHPQS